MTAMKVVEPSDSDISETLQLFRREIDKNMHNSSGSPGHDAMRTALWHLHKKQQTALSAVEPAPADERDHSGACQIYDMTNPDRRCSCGLEPAPDGLVERLRDEAEWYAVPPGHTEYTEFHETRDLLIEAAAALTSRAAVLEEKNDWIAVSDRLPDCEYCYCVIGCDSVGNVLPCEFWPDEQEFWPVNGKGEHWGDKYADITYWCELQKAPAIRAAKGE